MDKSVLQNIVSALQAGDTPQLSPVDFPAFSEEATKGDTYISPQTLDDIAHTLGAQDIATFERAIRAIDEGDIAWLGFKVVYDAQEAVSNTDNAVTKKYGEQGSADGLSLIYFCNDAKEVVASREYSARDLFQMKDATRGPSMHNEQFAGLTWTSVPLFDPIKVWLLGASDVASELATLAGHVDFEVAVVDYDPAFLSEARFPHVERILIDGFEKIDTLTASANDYVCVLTRGHMFDAECCIWALRNDVHYVGMMGSAGKNETIHDLVTDKGISEDQWARVKRPIGLAFGAKSPAELGIAIVAELIDVRYKQRYSEEVRQTHQKHLGRG